MSTAPEVRPRRDWRSEAACLDVDPDVFFPAAEFGRAYEESIAQARSICARCPVRVECLDFALQALPYGIAAGLTEDERRRLRGHDAHPFLSSCAGGLAAHTNEGSRGDNRAPLSSRSNALAGTRITEGHRS